MLKKVWLLGLGICLKVLSSIIPVKKGLWVFGSQGGRAFADNSKYFYLYVEKSRTEISPVWISQSVKVVRKLKETGHKCSYNFSLVGLYNVLRADTIIFCTSRNDILFVFPKRGRKIINLWHGMPMKKIVYDFPQHAGREAKLSDRLWSNFIAGFKHSHVDFIPATSDFFVPLLSSAFRNNSVFVTGLPRNDVFFEWNKADVKQKLGFMADDFIVTYMPTHRAYGKGVQNPHIFLKNKEAIKYFQANSIKVVWKFHVNMLGNYCPPSEHESVFVNLSGVNVDPQELLFVSDMLITDYSSCYIDFLLLNRPVAFYLYDNYQEEDNDLYFRPQDHPVGRVCFNEKDLFSAVKSSSVPLAKFYHHFNDGNASRRILEMIRPKYVKD